MQAFLVQVIEMDKATTKVWEAITALFLLKSSQWVQPLAHGKVSYWWLLQLKKILKLHYMAFKAAAVITNILNNGVFGLNSRKTADINNQLVLCGAFAAASEALPKSTTNLTSEQVIKRPRLSSASDDDMKSVIQVRMRDVQHMRDIRLSVCLLGFDIEDSPSCTSFGRFYCLQCINIHMIWINTFGQCSWLHDKAVDLEFDDLQSVRKEHWIKRVNMLYMDSDDDTDDDSDDDSDDD
jgi:hypothetical protein